MTYLTLTGPEVRAVLAGTKTQHRLILKPQPDEGGLWRDIPRPTQSGFTQDHWDRIYTGTFPDGFRCAQSFPFAPGDRIWVRETWANGWLLDGDGKPIAAARTFYKTDGTPGCDDDAWRDNIPWRSPAIMPRWASRITLTVTDVRVQRVQEIREDDARAEGIRGNASGPWGCEGLIEEFADYWNASHGPDAWDRNDWVAALTFTAEERNVDA
jgi:hypothetical protein